MSEEFPRHMPPGEGEALHQPQEQSPTERVSPEVDEILQEAVKEIHTPANPQSETRLRELWNRMNQANTNDGYELMSYEQFSDHVMKAASAREIIDGPLDLDRAPDEIDRKGEPAEIPVLDETQAEEASAQNVQESPMSPSLGAQNPNEGREMGAELPTEPSTPEMPSPITPEAPTTPMPQPIPGGKVFRNDKNRFERLPTISSDERAALESQYLDVKNQLDALTAQGVRRPRRPKDSNAPMPKMNPEQTKMMELMLQLDQVKEKLRNPIRVPRAPRQAAPTTASAPAPQEAAPASNPTEDELFEEEPVVGPDAPRNRSASGQEPEKVFTITPDDVKTQPQESAEPKEPGLTPVEATATIVPSTGEEPAKETGDDKESIVLPPAPGVAERLREMAKERGWVKPVESAPVDRQSQLRALEDQAATAADSAEYWKIQGQIHDLMTSQEKKAGIEGTVEFKKPDYSPDALRRDIADLTGRINATDDDDSRMQLEMQRSVLQTKLTEQFPLGDSRPIEIEPTVVKATAGPEKTDAAAGTSPEVKPETESAPKPEHILSLDDARRAHANAHRRERSWWSFGNKKELDRTKDQYAAALEVATRTELTTINKEFEGRDMKDPAVQAEYTAKLTGVALQFRMGEEGRFREALRGPEKQGIVEGFKTWWRKHSKARMITSVGLLGIGGVGALTGQFWVTGLAAGARGALAGLGTGMMTESTLLTAGRAWERKFGATKELTAEQIAKMTNTDELERRIAAYTLDTVEAHRKDFGKREAGRGKKKHEDRTAELLQERYGALLREQREQHITEQLKNGKSVAEVTEELITSTIGERTRFHDKYIERVKRNKKLGKWRAGLGVAAGLTAGIATSGGMRGATQWIKEHWFGETPDKPSFGIVSEDTPTSTSAVEYHPNAQDHQEWVSKVKQIAETPIVAEKGDSVWSMTEEFVNKAYPDLPPGQRTWIVDRFKDAISKHPEQFGLTDPNHIDVGQSIDFSKTNLDLMAEVGKAGYLPAEVTGSIVEHDKALDAWQAAHPKEMLTEEKVNEILRGTSAHETVAASPTSTTPSIEATPVTADSLSEQTSSVVAPDVTPVPETPPDIATPEVTHTVAETLKVTPALDTEYVSYQTQMMDIPEPSMDALRVGFEKISLQEATKYGPIENFLASHQEITPAKRELLTTVIHRLAKSLIESGHQSNESVSAALEWLRTNR